MPASTPPAYVCIVGCAKASREKVDAGFSQEAMRHQENLQHRAIMKERTML
jgi:hypothetical protein